MSNTMLWNQFSSAMMKICQKCISQIFINFWSKNRQKLKIQHVKNRHFWHFSWIFDDFFTFFHIFEKMVKNRSKNGDFWEHGILRVLDRSGEVWGRVCEVCVSYRVGLGSLWTGLWEVDIAWSSGPEKTVKIPSKSLLFGSQGILTVFWGLKWRRPKSGTLFLSSIPLKSCYLALFWGPQKPHFLGFYPQKMGFLGHFWAK